MTEDTFDVSSTIKQGKDTLLVELDCSADVQHSRCGDEVVWHITSISMNNVRLLEGTLYNIILQGIDEDDLAERVNELYTWKTDSETGYLYVTGLVD